MRILFLEDEKGIVKFVKKSLEAERFIVDVAYDGKDGLYKAMINDYDVIIIDILLPELNGTEVCREIRKRKRRNANTPTIMLTCKTDIRTKIDAFGLGADDYLTKPFSFEELLARVRALLRRGKEVKENVLAFENLTLDPDKFEATRSGKKLKLSKKEFALLEYLMRHPKIVLRREAILEHVWNDTDTFSNTVDAHVRFLRKKVDERQKVKLIRTVHGIGYKLDTKD
jgi:DNA-binding response OmpR family regulator